MKCLTPILIALLIAPALARPTTPDYSGEIFYQIMPIAWRDSNNDTNRYGDFGGLTASLDYLQSLGITAIYLNPIFPSPAYHGYQHGDASQLNPWFGTEPEFRAFIAAAHARRLKVFLDFVAYGIGRDSVWYRSAHNDPSSPCSSFLAFTDSTNSSCRGYTYTTWSGARVGFINWNLSDPGPVKLVTSWASHWLDGDASQHDGIDGFRLDHVYSNSPEGFGATISFWQTWATALRAAHPNVFLFCEPGDWKNNAADLLTPTGFDAALAKPWEFAAREALTTESAAPLYKATAASLAALPPHKTLIAQLTDHDSDRLASILSDNNAKAKAAAAVLLTQPFPPNIYYGDEIGMRGRKNPAFPGDAADIPDREPFKWLAISGPPMSNYFALNPEAYNARFEQDHDGRSVQEQQGIPGSLLEEYKSLIALRSTSPALTRGRYLPITSPNSHIYAFLRHDARQTVLIAINLSAEQAATTLDLSPTAMPGDSTVPTSLLTGAKLAPITRAFKAAYPIVLGPYGYDIISASLAPLTGPDPLP